MKLRNLLVLFLLFTGTVFFVACEDERGPAGVKGDKGDPGKDGAKGDDLPPDGDPRCDRDNGLDVSDGVILIFGTDNADVICANDSDNEIRAKDGNDVVYGGGHDKMIGGAGDDTLYSEDGNDHFYIWEEDGDNKLIGGEGKDIIYFRRESNESYIKDSRTDAGLYSTSEEKILSSDISLDLSSSEKIDASALDSTGTFTFEGIEDLMGGKGDDTFVGDEQDNFFHGWAGDDTLTGGSENDALADGLGDDILNGGDGDDVLLSYAAANTLTGGNGSDTFVVEHWSNPGVTTIKDFEIGEDKIYLNGFPTGDSNRAIDGANITVGTTTFMAIHKDGSASSTHADAIIAKKAEIFKFVLFQLDSKTRTYTFEDS